MDNPKSHAQAREWKGKLVRLARAVHTDWPEGLVARVASASTSLLDIERNGAGRTVRWANVEEASEAPAVAPQPPATDEFPAAADGGEPLQLWHHEKSHGAFQSSEEYPPELALALRCVYEAMFRKGFRDWELEWDYFDGSTFFLRPRLEQYALTVFRLWYGEANWRGHFGLAARRQLAGDIEFRVDHLLQSEFKISTRPPDAAAVSPRRQ